MFGVTEKSREEEVEKECCFPHKQVLFAPAKLVGLGVQAGGSRKADGKRVVGVGSVPFYSHCTLKQI